MKAHPEDFKRTALQELRNEHQRSFLSQMSALNRVRRGQAMEFFGDLKDQSHVREKAAQIRINAINRLPDLLAEFELNATQNGVQVLWAEDAAEANQLIESLVKQYAVKIVTKGKSMLSEEIDLNNCLEDLGVSVFEGDLGEFIVQQRGTPPFHIVGPAINLSVPEIAALLHEKVKMPYTEDPLQMADFVRDYLRQKFENAEMGISGVNFAIASSGSLLLVENEGNIRWVTSAPRVQVSLMSIDKVCPTLEDAMQLLSLLTLNCTSQLMTSYTSIINGPRKAEELDGPEAMYVIIIDNGRSLAYADEECRDAMRCIRCGRCLWVCPIWLRVGAYPYGWCYSGPLASILSPLLLGLDQTQDLYEACTLCGACQEICPVKIPHPELIEHYRQLKKTGSSTFPTKPVSLIEKIGFRLWAKVVLQTKLYQKSLTLVSTIMNLFTRDGYIRHLPGPVKGWFGCRDLPHLPKASFHQRWKKEWKSQSLQAKTKVLKNQAILREGDSHEQP